MENENLNSENQVIRETSLPLYSSKGWIKFLGVIMIVYGVLLAISLVGIIIAWLAIWLGIMLYKTAEKINYAHVSGDKEAMMKAQHYLASFLTFFGVLAFVNILLMVIFTIVLSTTNWIASLREIVPYY